jgi:two-component sensor histidine kinase
MLVRKDHSRFVARWVTTPIRDENRSLLGFAKVLRYETERRKAEERLRASLNERDTLLKEIHHRVKNNLQVITSLLSLQSDQISDPRALAMFNDTQSRVRAIVKIHESLYSSADLANIEFEQYTRALVQDLIAFYNIDPARIQLELNTDDIVLDITQAIPLGLILNELVVNCFKHAFPGDHRGRVEISLRYLDESVGPGQTLDEGKAQLCVKDTGVGMPPDFAFEQTESMGMYLVRILTRQLNGTATLHQTRGTRICVTFPLTLDDAGAVQ